MKIFLQSSAIRRCLKLSLDTGTDLNVVDPGTDAATHVHPGGSTEDGTSTLLSHTLTQQELIEIVGVTIESWISRSRRSLTSASRLSWDACLFLVS